MVVLKIMFIKENVKLLNYNYFAVTVNQLEAAFIPEFNGERIFMLDRNLITTNK